MGDIVEEDWNLPPCKYEYLDHTADVQLHAWGVTLIEAFEQCANAMFHYMTEVEYIEMKETFEIEASGHDMMTLLYNFLDELLFIFSAEPFYIARKVEILEFDRTEFKIKAKGFGEEFQLGKHPQGTEVKAITFSNMQIHESEGNCEVFVILDI
ncbi:protein archease-like isoform X2 [Adelges cooleyi]|uniref:protein archease-like isoform X2 n=1 Tax=Adelges cooleyi TaxID=133065 RepID=UPI00217F7981|nr:protein archease-like isoform X2 [Adelges cooleyi]